MELNSILLFVAATTSSEKALSGTSPATKPSVLFKSGPGLTGPTVASTAGSTFTNSQHSLTVNVPKSIDADAKFRITGILSGLKTDIESCLQSLMEDDFPGFSQLQLDMITQFQVSVRQALESDRVLVEAVNMGILTPAILYAEDGEVETIFQHRDGSRFSCIIPQSGEPRTWIVENGIARKV